MHSKENVKFSDVSVWMRTFRKMLENASVDVFMCIWINVDRVSTGCFICSTNTFK